MFDIVFVRGYIVFFATKEFFPLSSSGGSGGALSLEMMG